MVFNQLNIEVQILHQLSNSLLSKAYMVNKHGNITLNKKVEIIQ